MRCARGVFWSGGLVERSSDGAHELVTLEPVTEIVVADADLEVKMRSALFEPGAADGANALSARHALADA